MNSETLERLLMDRAVGGLPPDAAELLEAWLAENPAARNDAEEIEETIGLARKALREEKEIKRNVVVLPAKRRTGRVLTLAACFTGGLMLGVALHRGTQAAPPSALASAPAAAPNQNPKPASSIWSMARMHGLSAPEKRNVVWTSPVRKPKIL